MESSNSENMQGGAPAPHMCRGVLTGNRVSCLVTEEESLRHDQYRGGHNQVTGPWQCVGQAVHASEATGRGQGGSEPEPDVDIRVTVPRREEQAGVVQCERGRTARRKWTKEKNVEVFSCYLLSRPKQRGYRKRMLQIWLERGNTPESEQRLCDQIKAIESRGWISEVEKEAMKRRLLNQDQYEEGEEPDAQPANHTITLNNTVNEVLDDSPERNTPHVADQGENPTNPNTTFVMDQSSEEEMKKAIMIMMKEDKRERLPCLKNCKQGLLRSKVAIVDKVLEKIATNNISETNSLIYAGARIVTTLMDVKVKKKAENKPQRNAPPWLRRLNGKREEDRQNVARLQEMEKGKLKDKKKMEELNKRFKITERGSKNVTEMLKQRIKAKTAKIKRYEDRNKGYQQNMLFQNNQKALYSQLRGDHQAEQDVPDAKEAKMFWESIWSIPVKHVANGEWLQQLRNENREREKQEEVMITLEKLKKQLKKVPNWKAPGLDEVHGFWIKNFKSLHQRTAEQLQTCVQNHQAPNWMTTGRTTLTQKDKAKGAAVTNYRPITCLPLMWKLLTGIISEDLYTFLERTNTIPHEQKGCRKKCKGTKDQLLIDKAVLKNCKRRKTNLNMAWIDYKKAFDMVPHSWLIECLELYGAATNIIDFIKGTMNNWKTVLTAAGKTLAEVQIKRGIFQGDALSPLLFVLSMIPMTNVLNKMTNNGYQLERRGITINHLMFMDDIKLFGKSERDIETLVQTVARVTDDMKMEFGVQKCGVLSIKKGKVTNSEGITLPDQQTIGEIEGAGYKYLGILEAEDIKHKEMKEKIRKEYLSRVRAVLRSKLNGGNTITAVNTWAVPVIRYSAGIVDWKREEAQALDRKTRKLFTIHRALHPRSDVDRLYLPREDGGRGMASIEECINSECNALGQYIQDHEDPWLKAAWKEKVVTLAGDTEEIKRRMKEQRKDNWKGKVLHGQYLRQIEEISTKETWGWLRKGELKRETEGTILAAQEQSLPTNYLKARVYHTQESSICRMCKGKDETVNHIASECSALAQGHYKKRHDSVAKALHWKLSKTHQFPCSDKWYDHVPEMVCENNEVKLLWDCDIQTDHVIQARRPDIVLVEKKKNVVSLIDVAVPWDSRVATKEQEKINKYQDLKIELKRIWHKEKVEVIPIVIGALGAIPKNLKRNLESIGVDLPIGLLQKSVLLGTSNILRRVLST